MMVPSDDPSLVHDAPEIADFLQPQWVNEKVSDWGESLRVPELESTEYRQKGGWQGRDLIHDAHAAVRIDDYFVRYGVDAATNKRGYVGTTLTGIATFTERAESHRGYCHGGSMTSVLDDVVGWCGFLATGHCRPWSGYTVQINTRLCKPVMVGSTLMVRAVIVRMERRKVYIEAKIINPSDDDSVHATCEGIVVLNRGVLPET